MPKRTAWQHPHYPAPPRWARGYATERDTRFVLIQTEHSTSSVRVAADAGLGRLWHGYEVFHKRTVKLWKRVAAVSAKCAPFEPGIAAYAAWGATGRPSDPGPGHRSFTVGHFVSGPHFYEEEPLFRVYTVSRCPELHEGLGTDFIWCRIKGSYLVPYTRWNKLDREFYVNALEPLLAIGAEYERWRDSAVQAATHAFTLKEAVERELTHQAEEAGIANEDAVVVILDDGAPLYLAPVASLRAQPGVRQVRRVLTLKHLTAR